jgi:predicted dithiol-disulfide oxidoreductase (DUF899 family)
MSTTFPGETAAYRQARDRLLTQEIELRRVTEAVAAARRDLPPGGVVPEDYVFQGAGADGIPGDVRLSELFAPGTDSLAIYSFMFPRAPDEDLPCPSCTAFLDSFDGVVEHAAQRINVAVVAKAPLPRILAHADSRGWRRLRLLSSATTTYNHDYLGETAGRSATSGRPSSCSPRPSPVRILAIPTRSTRCGTSSTSPPTAAGPTGIRTSLTDRRLGGIVGLATLRSAAIRGQPRNG